MGGSCAINFKPDPGSLKGYAQPFHGFSETSGRGKTVFRVLVGNLLELGADLFKTPGGVIVPGTGFENGGKEGVPFG